MQEIREIKIVLPLPPITKKNHSRIVGMGRRCPVCGKASRQMLMPSAQYKNYEKKAGAFLKPLGIHIDYPVNVKCIYYMQTRRKVDQPNLFNATLDMLVHYNILEDDNRDFVFATDGSRVYHDKDFPRVEITITPIDIEAEGYERWSKK